MILITEVALDRNRSLAVSIVMVRVVEMVLMMKMIAICNDDLGDGGDAAAVGAAVET